MMRERDPVHTEKNLFLGLEYDDAKQRQRIKVPLRAL